MNHYTYILECDDKAYIGVRSCKCKPEDDNYWGTSKHLPKDISVRGTKKIVGNHKTRKEAVQREIDLHNLFDVAVNPKFWNRAKQTSIGFDRKGVKDHIITRDKKRDSRIGMKHSVETRRKISQANKSRAESLTEEDRALLSARVSGDSNPMFGIKGLEHPCSDHTTYHWHHEEFGEHLLTRVQMSNRFGIKSSALGRLITLERGIHLGWKLKGVNNDT